MSVNPFRLISFGGSWVSNRYLTDIEGQLAAVGRSQAVIEEFELDGTIRKANANFLRTMGYTLEEIWWWKAAASSMNPAAR